MAGCGAFEIRDFFALPSVVRYAGHSGKSDHQKTGKSLLIQSKNDDLYSSP